MAGTGLSSGLAQAADMPAPFDNPGDVRIALVRYLSTGQRKRAAFVRLRGQGAPIWLLDEPLNGLDRDAASLVDQDDVPALADPAARFGRPSLANCSLSN